MSENQNDLLSCADNQNSNQEQTKIPTPTKKEISSIRKGTKVAQLIEILKTPDGATIKQISEKLDWQNHTARGALSRLGKSYDVNITSGRLSGKNRTYKIA